MRSLLSKFNEEVVALSSTFYTWKGIHDIAYECSEIERTLNLDAETWNIILHSLQVTHFMTLGRIFDIDGDAFSIHKLLRECIDNIDDFSKEALRERKRVAPPVNADRNWLDSYMDSKYSPTQADFLRLRGETSKKQKDYEEHIKPIRHKVYAHTDFSMMDTAHLLFSKTKIKQIEDLVIYALKIDRVLTRLYDNGDNLSFDKITIQEEEHHKASVEKLLKRIKS
ncbi:hypothetical protein VDG1235_1824 [Verrucomicrobiia bacterium DG1235]|nr:hypothetical protein VDG1235_1824 [Verrucomicrobiae bacterium DG1235]